MPLDRLYQLDKSYAAQLDELLRDGEYVEALMGVQGDDLVELVNHLGNVSFSQCELHFPDRSHRPLTASFVSASRTESAYISYARYLVPEEFSPPHTK